MSYITRKNGNFALLISNPDQVSSDEVLDFLSLAVKQNAQNHQKAAHILAKKGKHGEILLYVKNARPGSLYQTFFAHRMERRTERAYQVIAGIIAGSHRPDAQKVLTHIAEAYASRGASGESMPVAHDVLIAPPDTFSDWKIPGSESLRRFAQQGFPQNGAPASLSGRIGVLNAFQHFVRNGLQRRVREQAGALLDSRGIAEFAQAWGAMDSKERIRLQTAWNAADQQHGGQGSFEAIDRVTAMICRTQGIDHPGLEKFSTDAVASATTGTASALIQGLPGQIARQSTHRVAADSLGKTYGRQLADAWLTREATLPVDFLARRQEIAAAIRHAMHREMSDRIGSVQPALLAAWALAREEFVHAAVESALDHFCDAKLGDGDHAFARVTVDSYNANAAAEGGFSKVRFGQLNGKPVAVKFLKAGDGTELERQQERQRERREFVREALTLQRMQAVGGDAITPFRGLTTMGDAYGLVFDAHPHDMLGKQMSKLVADAPEKLRSNLPLYSYLMQQMARGLRQTHAAQLVHGDIKPENFLITSKGGIQLCDYGTAQPTGSALVRGRLIDNPRYAAPETLASSDADGPRLRPLGYSEISEKADVWSLGILFCRLLTGKHPFVDPFDNTVMNNICRYASDAVSAAQRRTQLGLQAVEAIDRPLADLIAQMLDPDPARRPSSAMLENFLSDPGRARADGPALLRFLGLGSE